MKTLEEYLAGRALQDLTEDQLRNTIAMAPLSPADMNRVTHELHKRLEAALPPMRRVQVVGVRIPIVDLIILFFKLSIAAIPATLLWWLIIGVIGSIRVR